MSYPKANQSKLLITNQTKSTTPTGSLVAEKPSMFSNAQNLHFTDSSFNITTNVNTGDRPSLDALHNRVAPNAILNAGGRADEVRCHPGTREEVIARIEAWSDAQDGLTHPIFWLSGPAGAGKSAIMQTIAERCEGRGVPHANFFFFRADASRNDASPLIATLVHQIILLYPYLRDSVATLLAENPFIFKSALQDQVVQLIVTPLYSVQQSSSSYHPLLLLIDGLDECDSMTKLNQLKILRAFDQVLAQYPGTFPFRLLVASRDESQIRAAFNGISSQSIHLYLDDQYFPEKDILLFVNAQFEQIRTTHPLVHTLAATWPSVEDVYYIVQKSSGQFIYAATVMRFILSSSASPKLSLERVKGAARLATKSPFSHLDAIYTYILTQVDDQEAVKDILHAQLLTERLSTLSYYNHQLVRLDAEPPKISFVDLLERYFNQRYTEEVVLSCLADLTPIAQYPSPDRQLLFHHASFPDYLLDHSRSGSYFVDTPAFVYRLLPIIWKFIQNAGPDEKGGWIQLAVLSLFELHKLPPGLMNTMSSSTLVWSHVQLLSENPLFAALYKLCITDDDINDFKRIIRLWFDCHQLGPVHYHSIQDIPFGVRYYQMACADALNEPDSVMLDALCPETDFDRDELGLWLRGLLHKTHQRCSSSEYKSRLQVWIPWVYANNISYDHLLDIPGVHKFFRTNKSGKSKNGTKQGCQIQ